MLLEKNKSQILQKIRIKIKSNNFYYILIKVGIFPIKSTTITKDLTYKHKAIHIIYTIFLHVLATL